MDGKILRANPIENQALGAETNRLQQATASIDLTLGYGEATTASGGRMILSGFNAEIDAQKWLITEVEHRMDARGGYSTALKMEADA